MALTQMQRSEALTKAQQAAALKRKTVDGVTATTPKFDESFVGGLCQPAPKPDTYS